MFKAVEPDQLKPPLAQPKFVITPQFEIPFILAAACQFENVRLTGSDAFEIALPAKAEKFERAVEVQDVAIVCFQIVAAGNARPVASVACVDFAGVEQLAIGRAGQFFSPTATPEAAIIVDAQREIALA